ncbi:MAG: DUF4349 domain-containing protein [Clostridia bacterium]|nr:DUF4349 domain-containing protein [Clostridia bacterium]
MNCEAYQALLTSCLDREPTPEEAAQLSAHEAECPECRALRESLELLPDRLAGLREDVPPMPADLHQRWTLMLEEKPMENKQTRKPARRRQLAGILAAAAALVFIVGGTLMTRDDLPSRTKTNAASKESAGVTVSNASSYGNGVYASSARGYEAPAEAMVMDDYDTAAFYEEDMEAEEAAAFDADDDGGAAEERETKLIRNVSLTIVSRDFDNSLESLKNLAEGGWISYSSVTAGSNGLRTAWLTLRIPAEAVDAYLSGTEALGRITRMEETTRDVTDSYYDTASRLESQKALLARYQQLVAQAEDMSDLLVLENAMSEAQRQIDSYTASLRSTDSKVRYATVEISLREEKEQERLQTTELSLGERIGAAISVGWTALADFLEDALVFLVAALPFLILAGAVIACAVIVQRRRKARKAKEEKAE